METPQKNTEEMEALTDQEFELVAEYIQAIKSGLMNTKHPPLTGDRVYSMVIALHVMIVDAWMLGNGTNPEEHLEEEARLTSILNRATGELMLAEFSKPEEQGAEAK